MDDKAKDQRAVRLAQLWVWPTVIMVALVATAFYMAWVAVTRINADRDVEVKSIEATQQIQMRQAK